MKVKSSKTNEIFEISKRLNEVYRNMRERCLNEKSNRYKNYGGRGITICDEWLEDRDKFFVWALENGYEENLEIDRIDNDGNYEPSNCRFVTRRENTINRGLREDNKSGYIGIFWVKDISKWRSTVKVEGDLIYIGQFDDLAVAVIARDAYLIISGLHHEDGYKLQWFESEEEFYSQTKEIHNNRK